MFCGRFIFSIRFTKFFCFDEFGQRFQPISQTEDILARYRRSLASTTKDFHPWLSARHGDPGCLNSSQIIMRQHQYHMGVGGVGSAAHLSCQSSHCQKALRVRACPRLENQLAKAFFFLLCQIEVPPKCYLTHSLPWLLVVKSGGWTIGDALETALLESGSGGLSSFHY